MVCRSQKDSRKEIGMEICYKPTPGLTTQREREREIHMVFKRLGKTNNVTPTESVCPGIAHMLNMSLGGSFWVNFTTGCRPCLVAIA